MINKKIVVAALARDCKEALINNIPRLEKLLTFFSEVEFLIVENDSKDGTKEVLSSWAKKNQAVTVISQDYGTTTISGVSYVDPYPFFGHSRISKMAKYRNIYMDYIRENVDKLDYLVMLDIDVKSFDIEGIVKSIEDAPDNWGALFGYGKSSVGLAGVTFFDLYWDTYAYVESDLSSPITLFHINQMHRKVARKVKQEGFSRCLSAFGGVGVYRWDLIKDLRYEVVENQDSAVKVKCEHIPFNGAISSQHGLYISRDMVVDYGNKSLLRYYLRKIIPAKVRVFISRMIHKR